MNENKPYVLIFKSEFCHYCDLLKHVIETLIMRYQYDFDFLYVDVDSKDDTKFKELFEGKFEGVPSIIVGHHDNYVVVPDPPAPDMYTWFTLDYLDEHLNAIKGGIDEGRFNI